jgi:hypothetical protein
MDWLEPLRMHRPELIPEPRAVARAFGRASLTFVKARLVKADDRRLIKGDKHLPPR